MKTLDISSYIPKIAKLNPLKDSKFKYDNTRWAKLNPSYKILISDFEDKEICREDVINAYTAYYKNKGDAMQAFMLTMVWGFADTGYGTYRTNKYVTDINNISFIKNAIDAVNQNDLKTAFNELKKVKGLGVSYITKVLYFASRGANQNQYALIYDIRVATALIQLTTPKSIVDLVSINPSSKFKDYEKYNALIHNLATKNNVEPEAIEMFLFNQEF